MSIQLRLALVAEQGRQSTTKRATTQAETATDATKDARRQAEALDKKAQSLNSQLLEEQDSSFIEDVGSFIGGIFGLGSNKEDLLKIELQEVEAKLEFANSQAKLGNAAAARAVRDIRTADKEAEDSTGTASDMIEADGKLGAKALDEQAAPGASTGLNAEVAGAQAKTRAGDQADRDMSQRAQDRAQADVGAAVQDAHGKILESFDEQREKLSTSSFSRFIGGAIGLALSSLNPVTALIGAGVGELFNMADVGGHAEAAEVAKLAAEHVGLDQTQAQASVEDMSERVDTKDQAISTSRQMIKEVRNRQINRA